MWMSSFCSLEGFRCRADGHETNRARGQYTTAWEGCVHHGCSDATVQQRGFTFGYKKRPHEWPDMKCKWLLTRLSAAHRFDRAGVLANGLARSVLVAFELAVRV